MRTTSRREGPAVVTLKISTPGDVAVRSDGRIAISDMTRARVGLYSSDGTESAALAIADARSLLWEDGGALLAASTFPREVVRVCPVTGRRVSMPAELPVWLDGCKQGPPLTIEIAARRLRAVSFDGPARAARRVPGACHPTSFTVDDLGVVWMADRPEPRVLELRADGTVCVHALSGGSRSELTGICCDPSTPGALLVLDRAAGVIHRFRTGRFEPLCRLPGGLPRLRALRAHRYGRHPLSAVDPAAGVVLWLDGRGAVREVWRSAAIPSRPIACTHGRDGTRVAIVDRGGRSSLRHGRAGHSLLIGEQPRDVRILSGRELLVVLRDRHRVLRLDAALRAYATYGAGGELLYPCSADVNLRRESVLAIDPLRARLVEFELDGRWRGAIAVASSYVRWVRCTPEGGVWTIDVAERTARAWDHRLAMIGQTDLPPEINLSDVTSVEPTPGGGLLIGGPTALWAVLGSRVVRVAGGEADDVPDGLKGALHGTL